MKKALLIVGIICTVLSLCGVGISFSMPFLNPGAASWKEALTLGVLPTSICFAISFIIALVGLVLVLMTPKEEGSRKKPRRDQDEDDESDDDGDE